MEQINVNIRTFREKTVIEKDVKNISGYMYTIQGLTIILHEDMYKPGTYSCIEYFTGQYVIKRKDTMQEALDAVNERITQVGAEKAQAKVLDVTQRDGYANQPAT